MIPLQNFERHVAEFRDAIDLRLAAVQNRAHFILGPEVEEFEQRFASYIGTKHCIAVANGTQAMELALRALYDQEGDVVTTANAGMYATCATLSAGFKPVYCDIDATLLTMDPESLKSSLTADTRAVIVTHLYGQVAALDRIAAVCRQAGIALIEDCAEAHGASFAGRKVGAFGLAGCFSFYPTKNLGAYGDGGAVTTDSDEFAARVRSLRQYGWSRKYHAELPRGTNSRMDEMQAAVLNTKLSRLDQMNERRRRIAMHYNTVLKGKAETLPFTANKDFIVHHYVLLSADRGGVMNRLRRSGVGTDIHFPVPDYWQPPLRARCIGVSLPQTEKVCSQVFTVPSFPEMTDAEVELVSDALRRDYRP
jgi:aminotransferase EvaB